jgi:N-acetylmuramoyl-L-alanine amidase
MRICIDAGHGMSNRKAGVFDSGAVQGEFQEAVIVLDYAHNLKQVFEDMGHEVVMTRINENDHMPLGERGEMARGCDALLSLHCNRVENPQANGMEIFYNQTFGLAQSIYDKLGHALGLRERGVKQNAFRVLVDSPAPAALIELGFLSNPYDLSVILDPEKMQAACEAIAAGVQVWDDK